MELDITHMINDSDSMSQLSGSIHELGNGAARYTWNNSLDYAKNEPLLKDKKQIENARKYFKSCGIDDLDHSPDREIQALTVQWIAGDIREFNRYDSYEEYQQASENGEVSGSIFQGIDQKWYFYLGE